MKQVVSENDYERYKIYVPVKLFMTGKQRKYIYSQLEKLHPCFSDNFCFDSKYRVSRKGLCANVVVMDKLRLGEYKANYPGLMLTCEEKEGGKIFVDKKTKAIITSAFCLPLIAVMVMTTIWKSNPKYQENVDSNDSNGGTNYAVEIAAENEMFLYECLFDTLSSSKNQDGKIESLSWKYDGFTEQLSVSVVNCYPDAFSYSTAQNVSFSNISYVNDIPSFSMNVVNRKTADFSNQVVTAGFSSIGIADKADVNDYRSKIRAVLKENEIKLISETYLPYKIRFQISQKNIDEKVLSSLEEISINSGLCVREIDLNVSGTNSVDVEILFSDEFSYQTSQSVNSENYLESHKTILSYVESAWDFFAVKKSKPAEEKKSQNQSSTNNIRMIALSGSNQNEIPKKKIGTIIHADGEKVNFYKTSKGVIRNE